MVGPSRLSDLADLSTPEADVRITVILLALLELRARGEVSTANGPQEKARRDGGKTQTNLEIRYDGSAATVYFQLLPVGVYMFGYYLQRGFQGILESVLQFFEGNDVGHIHREIRLGLLYRTLVEVHDGLELIFCDGGKPGFPRLVQLLQVLVVRLGHAVQRATTILDRRRRPNVSERLLKSLRVKLGIAFRRELSRVRCRDQDFLGVLRTYSRSLMCRYHGLEVVFLCGRASKVSLGRLISHDSACGNCSKNYATTAGSLHKLEHEAPSPPFSLTHTLSLRLSLSLFLSFFLSLYFLSFFILLTLGDGTFKGRGLGFLFFFFFFGCGLRSSRSAKNS